MFVKKFFIFLLTSEVFVNIIVKKAKGVGTMLRMCMWYWTPFLLFIFI